MRCQATARQRLQGDRLNDDKRKPGRPALPPSEKLVVVPVRLTEAQKAKLQRIGVQRLRDWLDKAKETT